MIGSSNISLGPAYVIQDDYAIKSQQQQQQTSSAAASAAALNRPNIVAVAAAAAEAAAAMANLNVPQQQLIGDTAVMTIHDRQHQQPQDSPQDADPEPNVDNDMSQVNYFVFLFYCDMQTFQ